MLIEIESFTKREIKEQWGQDNFIVRTPNDVYWCNTKEEVLGVINQDLELKVDKEQEK